jgi:hypothetical protein
MLRAKIRRLPPINQATLRRLLDHLSRVNAHSEKNKMDVKNLSIVFGAVVFGEDDLPKGGNILSLQSSKVMILDGIYICSDRIS